MDCLAQAGWLKRLLGWPKQERAVLLAVGFEAKSAREDAMPPWTSELFGRAPASRVPRRFFSISLFLICAGVVLVGGERREKNTEHGTKFDFSNQFPTQFPNLGTPNSGPNMP